MKKHIVIALVYAAVAMACGVFYREFTKAYAFTAPTALGKLHVHLFMLGMFMFLIFALLDAKLSLQKSKLYLPFMIVYNSGVALAAVMLLVRGILQTVGADLSAGADGAVSGIAGLGHAVLGAGIVLLFVMLLLSLRAEKKRSPAAPEEQPRDKDEA